MYALGVQNLPDGPDWLYEIKFDGYRCIAGKDSNGVSLWSRRGNLFTAQFPAIAQACKQLPVNTIVDGEIVALDENGRNSFNLLQHHRSKASGIRYYLFDVLVYRGKSLIDAPLSKRRAVLNSLAFAAGPSPVVFSEPVEAPLPELLRAAKELSLEGVIAKRRDSLYESGKRSGAWVKYKINKGQEFVIGGYTPGSLFDAVIVGYYDVARRSLPGKCAPVLYPT
jgi:bifunctional non-homologous end joining protein LigD